MAENGKPKESIIELIKKCLALAESPNENEAASAAAMAQKLLLNHNLEISEVLASDVGGQEIPVIRWDCYWEGATNYWYHLCAAIGTANFCEVVLHTYNCGFCYMGRKHNVEVAKEVCGWIGEQIFRIAKEEKARRRETKRWHDSFLIGISSRVAERLLDQYNAQKKAMASNTTAMVIYNDKAVADFKIVEFPTLGRYRAGWGHAGDHSGYSAGVAAGDKVNIGQRPKPVGDTKMLTA